jgi:hypothetical protein
MSLLFCLPDRPRSRISAAKEQPAADNFLQKQQKQRGLPEKGRLAFEIWTDPERPSWG